MQFIPSWEGEEIMRYIIILSLTLFTIESFSATGLVVPSDRVTSGVRVRADINTAETLQYLSKGESAEYIESIPRWHKVKLDNGFIGYVSKSWTKLIGVLSDKKKNEIRR